jgi:hypothetical protein
MDVPAVYRKLCEEYKFKFNLKREQEHIIQAIVSKKHVCAILPTGFGKSLCFILPPLLLNIRLLRTLLAAEFRNIAESFSYVCLFCKLLSTILKQLLQINE